MSVMSASSSNSGRGFIRSKSSRSEHGRSSSVDMGGLEERKKQQQIHVISHWVNRVQTNRLLACTRSFYQWKCVMIANKYSSHRSMQIITNDNQSDDNQSYRVEQKNSYLLLFAENERLREQLNESRKISTRNEKQIRAAAMKSIVGLLLRSRLMSKVRYYYDVWLSNSKMKNIVEKNVLQTMKLEVGLQRIDSERNYVKDIEDLNLKLKFTLAMMVYFYKWKSKTASKTLMDERKIYEEQKNIIFTELFRIRTLVSKANVQEEAMLIKSNEKGELLATEINHLKEKMVQLSFKNGKINHSNIDHIDHNKAN
eukprot:gene12558-16842_t